MVRSQKSSAESFDSMAIALGRFVQEFSALERYMTWSLAQLLHISSNQSDAIFANMINVRDRIETLDALGSLRFQESPTRDMFKAIICLLRQINKERELVPVCWTGRQRS
jgi:hypothetical protein